MREIKFRGKRKDNDEWAYGYYKHDDLFNNDFILWQIRNPLYQDCYACVIPETIGQFTGLKDKNGVEIYEGDIITDHYDEKKYIVKYTSKNLNSCGCCFPSFGGIGFIAEDELSMERCDLLAHEIEIIGNIHEVQK